MTIKQKRAKELRESGLTMPEIGKILGITKQAVFALLNPGYRKGKRINYYYNKEVVLKSKIKNIKKINARWALQYAVKIGKIIRPDKCEKCDKICITQAHHYKGYNKKYWLKVKFLCIDCHTDEHII